MVLVVMWKNIVQLLLHLDNIHVMTRQISVQKHGVICLLHDRCGHRGVIDHRSPYRTHGFISSLSIINTIPPWLNKIIGLYRASTLFTDFEASLIRLLDKVTNGSRIEVNETGTSVLYQPGLLSGGNVEHDCNTQRAIGYYLEALICLAPFMKKPIKAVLRGVTNDQVDPSVDIIRTVTFPLLRKFYIDEGLELKITRRGAPPDGGGEVIFKCPIKKNLRPLQFIKPGKIKRVRGVAYALRVSPAVANRIVDAARSILNQFLPDIYIYTDHMKGPQSGKSPGFGLSLVAETTEGAFLSAELSSNQKGQTPTIPEDLGKQTAMLLMEEIYRGGCVDSRHQSLAMLFMALGQSDVSKLLTGPLSPYSIQFLRHMRDFFQLMFKMEVQQGSQGEEQEAEEEAGHRRGGDKVILTCVGVGFTNLSKTTL